MTISPPLTKAMSRPPGVRLIHRVLVPVLITAVSSNIGVGVVVLPLSPIVKRWMHLDTLRDDNVGDDLVGGNDVGEPQAAGMHPEVRG